MPASLHLPERLDFAQLPTPITPLGRTSEAWGGPAIWVKRDDDTGGLVTGNKIRKLQYVVHEALELGADTLVTCGGLQSNHCRATAAVASRVGLDCVLCLRGTPPDRPDGNYLLDRVLGAETRFVTPEEYKAHDDVMDGVAEELRSAGRRPYVIAEGASMATGTWGYIEACREIAEAEQTLGITFDAIVHAVGSGGTSAGLEIGARLFGLSAKIWGINVCDDAAYFRDLIHRIASEAIDRFDLPVSFAREEIGIIDGYVGRGYALSSTEELQALVEVARSEGLVLDPVYSGKAFFALAHEIHRPPLADATNILFIHTGGIYGLFPKAAELPL
jgi:D-cysteine desulfhydrase